MRCRALLALFAPFALGRPDGQTPIDYLDLESVGRVEAIRGTAAALYGNASGGVLDLRSAPPPLAPVSLQLRTFTGAYDLVRTTALVGGSTDRLFYQGNIG